MQNLAVQQGENNKNVSVSFRSEACFHVFRPESRQCSTIRMNSIRCSIIGSSACFAKRGNVLCETSHYYSPTLEFNQFTFTVVCSPPELCLRRGEELQENSNNKLCHTYTRTHRHTHTNTHIDTWYKPTQISMLD